MALPTDVIIIEIDLPTATESEASVEYPFRCNTYAPAGAPKNCPGMVPIQCRRLLLHHGPALHTTTPPQRQLACLRPQLSPVHIPPPQRIGDLYLMDLAISADLTSSELCGINLCHLSFNVLLLSDITNASGTWISPGILDGTLLMSQS